MFTELEKSKLKAVLMALFEELWENENVWGKELHKIERPYIGENTFFCMATAAVAVLEGAADIHESLRREGELNEQ